VCGWFKRKSAALKRPGLVGIDARANAEALFWRATGEVILDAAGVGGADNAFNTAYAPLAVRVRAKY
jgi:hypothetical protein